MRIRLGGQPMQILWAVLERPGEIVTREELRRRLWAGDTFGEFENGLNNAVKKLRGALGDSADKPLYIETIPRVGYRFVAPIEKEREPQEGKEQPDQSAALRLWPWIGAAGVLALLIVAYGFLSSPPVPRATGFVQRPVSDHPDGFARIATDGVRVFFLERAGNRDTLMQTSTAGGAAGPVDTPFPNTRIFDISPDRSEFLIGNFEARRPGLPLWIWPAQGGSPIRVGSVIADDASWAPNAQQILYARGSDIHIVGRDGNGDRVLIHTAGRPYWIQFSPDNRKMTYSVDDNQSDASTLWEAGADGRNPRQRFPGWSSPPSECCAEWTPDGKYLVFSSNHGGFENLWAIRERRSLFHWRRPVPVQLTPTARAIRNGVLTRNGTRAFVTAWNEVWQFERYDFRSGILRPFTTVQGTLAVWPSRDGTRAAVIKDDWTLWRTKGDGSAPLQLTASPLQASQPQWSPDGAEIAFEAHTFGKPVRAYVVNAEGGLVQEILAQEGEQSVPAWSPDGEQIAIAVNADAPADPRAPRGIYIVDRKTRAAKKVANSDGFTSPMWSPDGKYFTAKTLDERSILLFDSQTQQWKPIATGTVLSGLTWSRDSQYLYVQNFADEGQPIYRLHAGDFKPQRVLSFETALKEGVDMCALESGVADGSLIVRMRHSGGLVYALDLNFP
ncbi:MAG: winged helix-turn-helix domain-containing protein [Candidatus Acidiferrales bacterium]